MIPDTFKHHVYIWNNRFVPLNSPQAGDEGSAGVSVQEVDGEAFEGVSVGHRPPHRVLELLVAAGDAGEALELVGWQRWGEEVGQVVVPHGRQLQVLEDRSQSLAKF